MLSLKGLFHVIEPDRYESYGSVSWDFVTPDGSHWDSGELDFFLDKAFNLIAPGESKIAAKNFPPQCSWDNEGTFSPSPTYHIPRRYPSYTELAKRMHRYYLMTTPKEELRELQRMLLPTQRKVLTDIQSPLTDVYEPRITTYLPRGDESRKDLTIADCVNTTVDNFNRMMERQG